MITALAGQAVPDLGKSNQFLDQAEICHHHKFSRLQPVGRQIHWAGRKAGTACVTEMVT